MIPIGEDATPATDGTIHSTGEPSTDRHHAAPESLTIVRLDDQVRVVALQRVVHEPKSGAGAAAGEAPLDLTDDVGGAE